MQKITENICKVDNVDANQGRNLCSLRVNLT